MADDAIISGEKRDENGRFIVPPRSPGRPLGARSKLGEAFIEALHEDFQEHGVAAIQTVRSEKPDQYLKVIASLCPKELTLNLTDNMSELSDDEVLGQIRDLAASLAPLLALAQDGDGQADSPQVASQLH